MIAVRRRPRLAAGLVAAALALAPTLSSGMGARAASGAPTKGYWFVAGDGGIFSFGDASFAGSTGSLKLNQPIVGMAPTPTGRGYWFVAADGGIFSFGDAGFYGSTGKLTLNRPIVGMAPTPTGRGYWFVASDGGIFSFGDAKFHGSTGAMKLAKPIVGMAATPTGRGYWFVASDGGIFNFGDAAFHGSAAGPSLRSPIVSMAASPTGKGYFLASADGTVHAFGDAVFRGSMGGKGLKSPIVGLAPTATGAGYWLVAADGGIFSFGDAAFHGSTGALKLNRAIVGMAAAPQKTGGALSPNPGGGNAGGGGTPGGGTTPTTPGGGTTPTTLPAQIVDWGGAGTTLAVAAANRPASGGGNAFRPWLSDNGRYLVFDSDGKRILPGEDRTVDVRDIYLYDRTAKSIERITSGPNGAPANIPDAGASCANPCGSQRPTISADGRWIAFWSSADNLVAGDTNDVPDAFLHDRQTKTTTLISRAPNGALADDESRRPVVSRDGAFVVFESAASNLVAAPTVGCGLLTPCQGGDKNNADDVFLYSNPATGGDGKVTLVSAAAGGASGNGASNRPSLSGNGRKVAYQSEATNLASGATSGTNVLVRDANGATTFAAKGSSPSISANGVWVAFDTKDAFGGNDSGGDTDIYVKNLDTGVVEQASKRTDGNQASSSGKVVGADSTISADGRFVAFWSDSANLVDNDTNGNQNCKQPPCADVFVRDMVAKTTTRITATNGTQGDNDSYSPALSMDGRIVAFDSKANSLDPALPSNSGQDIYVHVNF